MLHGSQKRFDKDGDGKLSMREWNSWYYYAVGADEDARKRRAAYAAAEQKRAEIAEGFAAHAANIINWMYRNLAHLEGEREDQGHPHDAPCALCDLRRASNAEGR